MPRVIELSSVCVRGSLDMVCRYVAEETPNSTYLNAHQVCACVLLNPIILAVCE
jgi:hypothetical protein